MVPAMISMPAVQQVQERAKQQQNIRQDAEEVRPVFGPEEEGGYREKSEQYQTASRTKPARGARVRFCIHDFPSYSTITLPLNIPIWHENSHSPDSLGINSTVHEAL